MNLLHINQLSKSDILKILDAAEKFIAQPPETILKNKTIALLFFENSTRTRCSFEIAARKLSATVINLDIAHSSVQKGENFIDTARTLAAMGVDTFIIRHPQENAADLIAKHTEATVINAGTGTKSHPTQALLDMLTIRQYKKDFARLRVAFIGDIRHSRVAHSDIAALTLLGVEDIHLIGPENFLPENRLPNCEMFTDLTEGLQNADVVITLRIQKERLGNTELIDPNAYFETYGLTESRLKFAKPDAIVMHPAPMNRGIEIESAVADGPQSVIFQQIANGVPIRMAVLARGARN